MQCRLTTSRVGRRAWRASARRPNRRRHSRTQLDRKRAGADTPRQRRRALGPDGQSAASKRRALADAAYTGCERLRGSSGPPSRLWVCQDSRPRRRTRMVLHRNAKLGLAGRFALVQARRGGLSVREVARPRSASRRRRSCRWSRRWREASEQERASLVCLHDRSSRPRRMPRLLPAREQRRICAARRRTGWGPRLLTLRTGHPHSTISKVLEAARALAAAAGGARARAPLRVALPR